jgi:C1A family cysteine protease
MSTAAAVAILVQYFERRTLGRVVVPSVGFLYAASRRLAGSAEGGGPSLRSTLQALARFGCPPERFCPTDAVLHGNSPDPFAYGFQRDYLELRYARLDPPRASGDEILKSLKACLAAGFAAACVAALPEGVDFRGGDISYPTKSDVIAGGAALVIVGYDDSCRIRSTKGALIVRTTFGPDWGDAACGRLPYRYVEEHLACDFWTIWKPEWLAAGELEQPV